MNHQNGIGDTGIHAAERALLSGWLVNIATTKREDIAHARSLTALAVAGWFAAAVIAGLSGWVNQPGRPPLALLGFIVVPIAGFIAAYAASAALRAFVDSLSLTVLVGAHLWRFVGVFFLVGAFTGALPRGFGIPEGVGDIIAASGALLLIPMLRKGTASRRLVLVWNTFGTIDLLSAITVGVLYSNGPLGVLAYGTQTTELMATFPVSLIPTFFVPLFLLDHLLIFKRLAHARHLAPHGLVTA
jgi:hypothetical protein